MRWASLLPWPREGAREGQHLHFCVVQPPWPLFPRGCRVPRSSWKRKPTPTTSDTRPPLVDMWGSEGGPGLSPGPVPRMEGECGQPCASGRKAPSRISPRSDAALTDRKGRVAGLHGGKIGAQPRSLSLRCLFHMKRGVRKPRRAQESGAQERGGMGALAHTWYLNHRTGAHQEGKHGGEQRHQLREGEVGHQEEEKGKQAGRGLTRSAQPRAHARAPLAVPQGRRYPRSVFTWLLCEPRAA